MIIIVSFVLSWSSYSYGGMSTPSWSATWALPGAPGTLPDGPWRCIQSSLCPKKPIGRPHVAKVLLKFTIFSKSCCDSLIIIVSFVLSWNSYSYGGMSTPSWSATRALPGAHGTLSDRPWRGTLSSFWPKRRVGTPHVPKA